MYSSAINYVQSSNGFAKKSTMVVIIWMLICTHSIGDSFWSNSNVYNLLCIRGGEGRKIFHFIVSTVGRTSCSSCCCWPQRLNYSNFAFKAASLWLYTELSCSGSAARQPLTPSNSRPHEPNPLGHCQPNPFSNSTGKEQIPSRFLVLFDSKIGNGSVCKSMCHWIDQSRA